MLFEQIKLTTFLGTTLFFFFFFYNKNNKIKGGEREKIMRV
jgi:hypothetical protein